MSFEKLVETLAAQEQTLAKSLQGAQDGQGAGGEAAGGAGANAGSTSAETPMVKSFEFVLEDGTKVIAQDASEVVAALQARIDTRDEQLTKALTSMATMVKSLGDAVAAFGAAGRGRKAVLAMPATAGATNAGAGNGAGSFTFDKNAVMAKALEAQEKGLIEAAQVSEIEFILEGGNVAQIQPLVKAMGL